MKETLLSPYSAGKTFEIRRDETESGRLSTSSSPNNWFGGEIKQDFARLFRSLVLDSDRVLTLPPFPIAMDPPPPVSPERINEILNDPRVQAVRVRDETISSVEK